MKHWHEFGNWDDFVAYVWESREFIYSEEINYLLRDYIGIVESMSFCLSEYTNDLYRRRFQELKNRCQFTNNP
jgi:hypothetical protein